MLSGEPPYAGLTPEETLERISQNGLPEIPELDRLSLAYKDLLTKTLTVDPENRPSAATVLEVC